MMISPEGYYEMNLKGKSEKEIRSAIRGLKNEIRHLKNTMEHPEYSSAPLIHPTEDVRIWCTRMYLERAKQALLEMGATYAPSQAELKSQQFQDNIDYIKKIRFEIGGYFGGYEFYTITIDDEHIHYDAEHSLMLKPFNLPDTTDYPMSKAEFLDGLRELYIGEWRPSYNTERFGYMVLDGTQWSLDIEYSNGGKPAHYYGSNSYPYNFDKLKELFGIEDDIDCETEE
ncbi:MAG: hypothetical protein Q4B75_09015 [Eubacteriales bacterium]|nr:hypothetical protein [Eubacteriales bacterium]